MTQVECPREGGCTTNADCDGSTPVCLESLCRELRFASEPRNIAVVTNPETPEVGQAFDLTVSADAIAGDIGSGPEFRRTTARAERSRAPLARYRSRAPRVCGEARGKT